MSHIHDMLVNSRRAYESMSDAELIAAMDEHMHLHVDPVADGIVGEDGELSDREAAILELLRADERELGLLGYG